MCLITVFQNQVKASDLRKNLENLQAEGGPSPHVSDLVPEPSEAITVTAREPAVRPGPPQKEEKGSAGSKYSLSDDGKMEANLKKDSKISGKEVKVNEAVAKEQKHLETLTTEAHPKINGKVKKVEPLQASISTNLAKKGKLSDIDKKVVDSKSKSSKKKMFSFLSFKK